MEKQTRLPVFFSWYASLSIVIGPILQPYTLYGKSIALLLMFFNIFLFSIYSMMRARLFIKPNSKYIYFLVYGLTIPIFCGVLLYKVDVGASVRVFLVFSACLLCYISFANITYIKKNYRLFVYLAIGVFFAQEFCWHVFGFRFPALIPFFELNYEMGMEEFLKSQLIKDRSSSFFLEPAHLAVYVLPYFAIKMKDNELSNRMISFEIIFLTFFLIYLRSGLGFVCLTLLWLLMLSRSRMSHSRKLSFVLFAFFVLGLALIVTDLGAFFYDSFFSRAKEIISSNSENESGMIRVIRGFLVYQDFPLLGKIFGVSNGAISDVVTHSSVANMFDNETYLNNIQKLLIGYGFIGCLLFLSYIHSIIKRNPYTTSIIAVFIVICFMENMLFDSQMMLYFAIGALPYSIILKERNDKKGIYNY